MESWAVKTLSYGERLQLVKSILSSIHVYWFSIFILPQKLIKKIESMLASFLWSGELKTIYNAKVSWKEIACSVKEGGLGVMDIYTWNKSLVMKQIWFICLKKLIIDKMGTLSDFKR